MNKTFISGTREIANLFFVFDQWVIDGVVNNTGLVSLFGGESTRYGGSRKNYSLFICISNYDFFIIWFLFVLQ
jgi:hypothetical protein